MKQTIKKSAIAVSTLMLLGVAATLSHAQSAADLGGKLTCSGAQKAGGGGVADYTAKWKGAPSGVTNSNGVYGDPYAGEQPTLTITGANADQYKANLSPGQLALLKKYPDYKMNVYPSHRDFDVQGDCAIAKANMANTKIINDGEGVTGAVTGGTPFPIPKSSMEVFWNTKIGGGGLTSEYSQYDSAAVQPNGSIAWGKEDYVLYMPTGKDGMKFEGGQQTAMYRMTVLLPERSKGEMVSGYDHANYKTNPRKAWQYQPGTRRVRELPEFGFDFPRGPGGLRTVDDDRLFNGTPERYDWKLVGKKTYYVPYNAYLMEKPGTKYSELLTPKFPNPSFTRWELHRVWELDAKLKPGMRHNYARRVLFLDEDTWVALMTDIYDSRGQLWRTAWQNYVYGYDVKTLMPRTAFYLDLNSGAYYADRLWTQSGKAPQFNNPKIENPNDYGANALRAAGK